MTWPALRRGWRSQSGGIISSLISLVFLVVLLLALYFARHPLMRFAAEAWIVEDPLEHADAIIVLSDDNYYADRVSHAADLYRHGMAPLVVASGRKLRPYAGIAELMEHDLVERGVPKDRVLHFPHQAENTHEEAIALRQLVVERKWRNVIVVTSSYHTRRTRYLFTHIMPAQTVVKVSGAKDGDFDPENWWERRVSVKRFANELGGMVVAIWEVWNGEKGGGKAPQVVGLRTLIPQGMV